MQLRQTLINNLILLVLLCDCTVELTFGFEIIINVIYVSKRCKLNKIGLSAQNKIKMNRKLKIRSIKKPTL